MNALSIDNVTHRFSGATALIDCDLTVPAGAVAAVVGRNGAGKSTLFRVAVGLLRPDRGAARVFGEPVGPAVLPRIGYVGQRAPLYLMLTVAQTLRLGRRLNPTWDAGRARRLADDAALRPTARVGTLAPGLRGRLAIAMALGKRPDLLVLDEPLAHLDPVARAEVVGVLMAEVAERGVTVVMSAHVVADVHDTCDHVIALSAGRVRLAAPIELALSRHWIATGPAGDEAALAGRDVVELTRDGRGFTALVRTATPDPGWHRPTLEELLLGHLRTELEPA